MSDNKKHYYQFASHNDNIDPEMVGKYSSGYRSFSTCGTVSDAENDENMILQDSVDAYLAVCLPCSESTDKNEITKIKKIGQ